MEIAGGGEAWLVSDDEKIGQPIQEDLEEITRLAAEIKLALQNTIGEGRKWNEERENERPILTRLGRAVNAGARCDRCGRTLPGSSRVERSLRAGDLLALHAFSIVHGPLGQHRECIPAGDHVRRCRVHAVGVAQRRDRCRCSEFPAAAPVGTEPG